MRAHALTLALLFALAPLAGCPQDESPPGTGSQGKEDDPCKRGSDCLPSLVCAAAGSCQRPGEPGTATEGEGCGGNDDCRIELVCSTESVCAKPGPGSEGSDCIGNESCQKGLMCSATLKCAQPGSPGTKIVGDKCDGEGQCALGLLCLAGECQRLAFWTGADCQQGSGKLRAYFEIPRGGKALGDFYRLPFPNDIRLTSEGTVDVTTHPDPGVNLPEPYKQVVRSYYDQIKKDVKGFGVNTATYFRFSAQIDLESLTLGGANPTVQFLDITPTSPGYAKGVGLLLGANTGRGKYICQDWMNVRPTIGQPLRAKTTYAVLLRKGIKGQDKTTDVQQDADFAIVIGKTQPTDPDERRAWQAYQPLRDYLEAQSIDATTVISATVFTTMDPQERMAALPGAVDKQPAPVLEQLTVCDTGVKSPCDDPKDATRGCPSSAADGRFHELHGLYKTPVFQQGTRPYKTPADGGDLVFDVNGEPVAQGQDDVCVAMTVPKSVMPQSGWPVVIFAAGTGGSFRSFINNGTAAALSDVKDAAGTSLAGFLVVSIDPAMHGPRRGSDDSPDQLFFNLLNPKAARDNVLQGAADKLQLVRLIKSLDLDATTSPTGEAIKIDPTKIYYFGHSQGTIEGLPFVAFSSDIKGTVMSGAGGYLIGSLLAKTKPFDVASLTKLALADGDVTSTHPLLNLLQLYYEEVDSLNYGRSIAAAPPGLFPKHFFLSYGAEDSFTPPGTIEALTRASGLPQLVSCGDGVCTGTESCSTCPADCPAADCNKVNNVFTPVEAPVSGNISKTIGNITALMVRYHGDGSYDDHHVLFNLPIAKSQSTRFLGTAAKDGIPTVTNEP